MNFEDQLYTKINEYFNYTLKYSLKYDDIFTISIGNKVILLENQNISTISKELIHSQLIRMLNSNKNILKNIEDSIQKGMHNFNIKIITIDDNDFVIQY